MVHEHIRPTILLESDVEPTFLIESDDNNNAKNWIITSVNSRL